LETLEKRSELGDIVNQLSTLDACLSTILDSSSVFQVGDCAFRLRKLKFPLVRIARLKELVGDFWGAAKAVKMLAEVKSVDGAVTACGTQLLDLNKEAFGVKGIFKACKFLI